MDFSLKQWRDNQHESEGENPHPNSSSAKLLRFHDPQQQQQSALPLFVPEPTSKLSAYSSDSTPSATKLPRMESYFSLAQWQELELQALIFRHMLAGSAVPPELLHLVKKSLISSASPPPYYLSHSLHQYYPQYQPALLQSGYWGRAAMDPEPGRCRRTDGKKWRCSRDVVAGHKYCERHMHRGRNRSRKPVENPTSTTSSSSTTPYGGGNGGGAVLKSSHSAATQTFSGGGGFGGGTSHFALSGPSPSMDLLHLNQRSSEPIIETKAPFGSQSELPGTGKSSGQTLRHFFDDWPRSLDESSDNAASSPTNLSISMPGNPSSDFSLKLSTGDASDSGPQYLNTERNRPQLSWGATWGTNHVGPMGGPLAEVLRSSTSNSSPTSVLHQLQRGTISEASFIST